MYPEDFIPRTRDFYLPASSRTHNPDRDDIETSSGSHVKESEYVLPHKIECIEDQLSANLKVGFAVRAHARARCPCPPPIRKAERDERERTKSQRAAAAVVCAMFRSS